ncbi:MAG: hypothetical protein P8J32_04930 [bacterium]|nr:hypothetical protein [bacterium]
MKNILALMALVALSVNVFATNVSGFVTQTNGECVSIEIISSDGDFTFYQCTEDNALLGLKKRQSFSIDLDKDSYYTLIFTCGNGEDKYVYVDTHNIGYGTEFGVLMYEYDAVVHFEPLYNQPHASEVQRVFLEWMCKHFPEVRDYNSQLEELGEEPVNCS